MIDHNKIMQSNQFRSNFWDWFDSLSIKEKELFWYYHHDTAKIYYYNKIYSKNDLLNKTMV